VRAADLASASGLQVAETANRISDVVIPDSELARDAAQFIRDSEGDSSSSIQRASTTGLRYMRNEMASLTIQSFCLLRRCFMIAA
jgi:hypothetical protein